MVQSLAKKVARRFVKWELVTFDQYEMLQLGLEIYLTTLLQFTALVLIGFLFQIGLETLVFLLFFSSLRAWLGGYHATTLLRCTALMLLMIGVTIACVRTVPMLVAQPVVTLIMLLSFAMLMLFSELPKLRSLRKSRKITFPFGLMVYLIEWAVVWGLSTSAYGLYWAVIAAFAVCFETLTLMPSWSTHPHPTLKEDYHD